MTDLNALFPPTGEADATIDLTALSPDDAMTTLREAIDAHLLAGTRSALVKIRGEAPVEGETLFQPIGRHLLGARRLGRIHSLAPLADGSGFFIAWDVDEGGPHADGAMTPEGE